MSDVRADHATELKNQKHKLFPKLTISFVAAAVNVESKYKSTFHQHFLALLATHSICENN